MENKTDKPYSLQDAKEITVKKMHYHDWKSYMKDNPTWYDLQEVADKAAELYKDKATEELRTYVISANSKIESLKEDLSDATESIEELRNELEVRKSLGQDYATIISVQKNEIDRLTQSNKELVEALKELYCDTVYTNMDGDQQFMWGRTGGTRLSSAAIKAQEELKKAGLNPYIL